MSTTQKEVSGALLDLLWWNSDLEEWELQGGTTPEALEQAAQIALRERFKQKVLELRRGCLPISDAGAIAACDELLRWLEVGA